MRGRLARVVLTLAWLSNTLGGQGQLPASNRERAYRANNQGVSLLEQFSYAAAARAFHESLRLAPGLALAQVNLGIALFYAPDLVGASREAAIAVRQLPDAPQPQYILGLIARAENRDDEAIAFFERVRQLDSRDVGAAVNIGQIYLQDRKYAEAIAVLRPAVADEPFNITATYNLGLALTRAGQRVEGLELMERSQALRATGYGVVLSNTYMEQGRYAEAIASTGAEPDVLDTSAPAARLSMSAIAAAGATGASGGPSPFGRTFSAAELAQGNARSLAAGLGGGIALADVDGDGDLDLFVASPAGVRLYTNDGRGGFTDVTASSGLAASVADGVVAIGCVVGDVDNDGKPDLFVLAAGGNRLYHNDGGAHFTDVTARSGFAPYPFLSGAVALVDVDHDGDLDIVIAGLADVAATAMSGRSAVFPKDFAPAPLRLERNNGDGTFTDITAQAGLAVTGHAIAIVPTDFDNRRDMDLLVVYRDAAPRLFKNLRDGTFRDVAADVGLSAVTAGAGAFTSVAAADLNKDDFPDLVFGRSNGPALLALSDGRGRFNVSAATDTPRGAAAAQVIDYDNDGLLDLVVWRDTGPHVLRNMGRAWSDVTGAAVTSAGAPAGPSSPRAVAAGDVDGDGATDLVVGRADGSLAVWRNSGDPHHAFVRVHLKGRVSNRSGAGSKISLRAGSLTQRLETSAATPAVAPADVVFGLGGRDGADVVRVLWPSGILQAESATTPEAAMSGPLVALPQVVTVEELDRKPSSCPFLYTWDGERFTFVTDFMGGGEMGYWEGPGALNTPNPVEYVRIRGDQLRPKDGRYEIRVTNELEETVFVDRLQLWAIAHPANVDVFPNEGMTDPPKPYRLFSVADQRVPVRVVEDAGRDVTDRIARVDRRYPDGFALKPIRGYAADHALTIDLGRADRSTLLLLTAWTDYAFSSDNVAGHQAGWSLRAPSLDVRQADGSWRRAIDDIGIPVGRPQTMVVEAGRVMRDGEHEVRIVTNMRIYWDQILAGESVSGGATRLTRLDPRRADLHTRGFSIEQRPDGHEPPTYDYRQVTTESPWKTMVGRYTREGDVLPLLTRADDMFVVAKPGDEIVLSFDAASARTVPAGWTQTFLLVADGFSKEMDINSASPDRVEPLPFHGMSRYPYAAPEHYPDAPAYERYRSRYNTRAVSKE